MYREICSWENMRFAHRRASRGKRGREAAAPFRDRVVHHALRTVTEPLFERSFSAASFVNRVGKGTHRALDRAQALARRFRYVLQFDVEQFFPAIDHCILRATLARKLDDPDVLGLVDRILASGEGVLSGEYPGGAYAPRVTHWTLRTPYSHLFKQRKLEVFLGAWRCDRSGHTP
jgi:hypothetical protein